MAITAVAGDPHSITLLEVGSGTFQGTLYITSGNIIGQPMVSGNTIVVNYQEGGHTYMNSYAADTKMFLNRIMVS